MKIVVASSFQRDWDSGAAGTLLAVGRSWQALGHDVEWLWGRPAPLTRMVDELVRIPAAQARAIRANLRARPDTDIVIASQPYAYRAFRMLRREFPRTLFVNRTHGWEARWIESQNQYGWDEPTGVGNGWMRAAAQALRKRMCRLCAGAAHGIVAACHADADWIRRAYRLPDWAVTAIPYGIDPAELPPPTDRAADRRPVRLIFLGQYCERKGSRVLETVLPAIAGLHGEPRLTFVVQREAVDAVDRFYRPTWGDRLTVTPWVPRVAILRVLQNQDALLFPTYFEGYGKVILEALAMGCVAVGFEEGGFADLKSPTCLTCPKGDVPGFGRLVRSVVTGGVDLRRLSKTWRDTAAETVQFFDELRRRHGLVPAAAGRARHFEHP
jgi:glycosyltransferase involved in cell wall biosynthesis